MKTILVSVILGCFALAASANDTNAPVREVWSNISGNAYKQGISRADVELYPSWDPITQPCPLSPEEATQRAIRELRRLSPSIDMTRVKIEYITLERPVESMHDRWHYQIFLLLKHEPGSEHGAHRWFFNVIVCLDGTMPPLRRRETGDPNKAIEGTGE
jgi:hypothetical protein